MIRHVAGFDSHAYILRQVELNIVLKIGCSSMLGKGSTKVITAKMRFSARCAPLKGTQTPKEVLLGTQRESISRACRNKPDNQPKPNRASRAIEQILIGNYMTGFRDCGDENVTAFLDGLAVKDKNEPVTMEEPPITRLHDMEVVSIRMMTLAASQPLSGGQKSIYILYFKEVTP
jgi:hypothetical protein